MQHLLSFDGPATGLTKPYKYQVMYLAAVDRVQLWYQQPGHKWEIGHGTYATMLERCGEEYTENAREYAREVYRYQRKGA